MSIAPVKSPRLGPADPANVRRTAGGWFVALLLVACYPLALVLPAGAGAGLVFHVSLPVAFLIGLLALGYLACTPWRCAEAARAVACRRHCRIAAAAFGLALGLCAISGATGVRFRPQHVVALMGFFAFPFCVATCARKTLPRHLPLIFSAVWGIHVAHGIWQLAAGREAVGLAGNPNWAAPVFAGLAPWPILAAGKIIRRRTRSSGRGRIVSIMAAVAVVIATACLLVAVSCRATWVVLAAYALLYLLLPRFSKTGRVLLLGGLAAVAVTAVAWYPQPFRRAIAKDIRVPCYAGTLRMIGDHPWLGVGAGNFRRVFVQYRSRAHKKRVVAAPVTEHPHNEVLRVASEAGIPAAFLWIGVLLVVLMPPPRRTAFWRIVHFSAFVVIGHAMFDKQLVQPPVNAVGLLMVGLLWRPRLRVRLRPGSRPHWQQLTAAAVLTAGVLTASYIVWHDVVCEWYLRRAALADKAGDARAAYHAYRKSIAADPWRVRPHALAGVVANARLQEPRLALEHLMRAREIEPDFAHLNGETGRALGALGKQREALPFFEREVNLYPFDVVACQQLLTCRLLNGRYDGLASLYERLGTLRRRHAANRVGGRQNLALLGHRWLLAIRENRLETAQAIAERLLAVLPATAGVEAGPGRAAYAAAFRTEESKAEISNAAAAYWNHVADLRRSALAFETGASETLVRAFLKEDATRFKDDNSAVFALMSLAYQAGFEVGLVIAADGTSLGVVEVTDGQECWLAQPESQTLLRGVSAGDIRTSESVAKAFRIDPEIARAIQLALPAAMPDFHRRTQALAHLVEAVPNQHVPFFGRSPAVRWRTRVELAPLLRPRHAGKPGSAPALPIHIGARARDGTALYTSVAKDGVQSTASD